MSAIGDPGMIWFVLAVTVYTSLSGCPCKVPMAVTKQIIFWRDVLGIFYGMLDMHLVEEFKIFSFNYCFFEYHICLSNLIVLNQFLNYSNEIKFKQYK